MVRDRRVIKIYSCLDAIHHWGLKINASNWSETLKQNSRSNQKAALKQIHKTFSSYK